MEGKGSWFTGPKLIAGLIGLFIVIALIANKTPDSSPPTYDKNNAEYAARMREENFNKMPPAEHLAKAKAALDKNTNLNDAKKHLTAIQQNAPEAVEKENLLKEVAKREKEKEDAAKKKLAAEKKITDNVMVQMRKDFANKLELTHLDRGMDTTVTTEGKEHRSLRVRWILMSRPLVHKFINDSNYMATIKSMGFKKLIYTDGYNNTWVAPVN